VSLLNSDEPPNQDDSSIGGCCFAANVAGFSGLNGKSLAMGNGIPALFNE
jgi:hypothetical protein